MKIFGKCLSCKQELSSTTNYYTRVEVAMHEGNTKILHCAQCDEATEIHIDQLYAKENQTKIGIATLCILIVTAGLVLLAGFMLMFSPIIVVSVAALTPLTIYFIILQQERIRVNSFNQHKLKGRLRKY